MTNHQLKQKAIQEAYGEHWEQVRLRVNENGWYSLPNGKKSESFCDFLGNCDMRAAAEFRPKSLTFLEANNGWTRIEPDGSNLPATEAMYKVIDDSGYVRDFQWYDNEPAHELWKEYGITHYRPVTELPKPIY